MIAGGAVAYFTYRKVYLTEGAKNFAWPVWLLALLRFVGFSLLAFLLLSPVVKSIFKRVEKPVVIIAADNSESILLNRDSAYYRKKYPEAVQKLTDALADRYDVRTFSFGGKAESGLRFDFTQKKTDISGLYDKLYNTFYNQNIGAVITLTDGIYNEGQNPLFTAEKFNAPFYMVALGDTQPQNDVLIQNVQYNQVVYAGNLFPLQFQLRAKGYRDKNVEVKISDKGNTVFSQQVHLTDASFFKEISAQIKTSATGLQHYRIEVSRQPGEISYANNVFDFFVEVLESRQKILIVGQSPHPDLAALKHAIEENSFYEVNVFLLNDFLKNIGSFSSMPLGEGLPRQSASSGVKAKLKNYQLAILHQLPGRESGGLQLINALKEAGVPVLYVIGSQTYLPAFNNLESGTGILQQGGRTNDAGGFVNPAFGLFTLSPDLADRITGWPPLSVPFGDYKAGSPESIVLYQQLGKVKTDLPLLAFSQNSMGQKSGVLCGEGLWRWRLSEYARFQDQKAFNELTSKTVQYLSVKTDNRLFRLHPAKNFFTEDEPVTFEAEVYNPSFEPVTDAAIEMRIRDSQRREYVYQFQPRGDEYFLDASHLPAGTYTYQAQTKIAGKTYTLSGEFLVKKIELEYLETIANHQLLNTIAAQQGGALLYPAGIADLPKMLKAREDIKPVAFMQTDFRDLIDFKWLFFLLLALFGTEWFLRKYYGAS